MTTYVGNKHEERAVAARAVLPLINGITDLILSFLPSCECGTTTLTETACYLACNYEMCFDDKEPLREEIVEFG